MHVNPDPHKVFGCRASAGAHLLHFTIAMTCCSARFQMNSGHSLPYPEVCVTLTNVLKRFGQPIPNLCSENFEKSIGLNLFLPEVKSMFDRYFT